MNNSFLKSVIAGIAATIAMTALMMVSAMMGMPKMEPPKMLAETMEVPIAVGWVMHFMIGIIFALLYVYVIRGWLTKISSPAVKGIVFGIIAFIIAQIGMAAMGAIFPNMPTPEGSMVLLAIGSLVGHIVFGIVVALMAKETTSY